MALFNDRFGRCFPGWMVGFLQPEMLLAILAYG
jgi:hypothetical protein